MNKQGFTVSIVVPVYNEEESIQPFLNEILPVIKDYNWEIFFVNDGSKDGTEKIITRHAKKDKRIKLLSFVRNFGHQTALTAGYRIAKGDCVVTIDVDLQDPPNLIPKMIELWKKGDKIVYAQRAHRVESFFKKYTAELFYKIINSFSESPIPKNVGDYRLMDHDAVNLLNSMPEKSRFLRGMVAWSGYPSSYVTFTRHERALGETHYPLSKMIALALNGILSFSTRPLRLATYLGFIASGTGIGGILYALYRRLFLPNEYWVTEWIALFVAVVFFGGVQLITIGIIGEYIGKIFKEIQGRPDYIVDHTINV